MKPGGRELEGEGVPGQPQFLVSPQMSSSSCLCLLTLVGLIVLPEGKPLMNATISPGTSTTLSIHTQTQVQETDSPEVQSQPPTPALQPNEPTKKQRNTQRPTRKNMTQKVPLVSEHVPGSTPPVFDQKPTEGTTSIQKETPERNNFMTPGFEPTDPPKQKDPRFYYDEATLRKRGLLIAAVLFITGIIILTSGKCRRLPQLCQKNQR